MSKIKLLFLPLIAVTFFSCEKSDENDETQFNITSIVAGTEYKLDDTVFIKGSISSLEELNGFQIEIKNSSANDSIVFSLENSNISKSFSLDTFWVNDVSAHSDMLFKAFADDDDQEDDDEEDDDMDGHDDDHDENLIIPFHCHPM